MQSHVYRDGNGTNAEASEERLEQSRPVPLHKCHAISWTYTKGLQSLCQLADPLVQFRVRELLLTILDCQPVTVESTSFRQKGPDVRTTPRLSEIR